MVRKFGVADPPCGGEQPGTRLPRDGHEPSREPAVLTMLGRAVSAGETTMSGRKNAPLRMIATTSSVSTGAANASASRLTRLGLASCVIAVLVATVSCRRR